MTGTLTPKLGDYRFSATREPEVYILVNEEPQWREFRWETRNNYFCSRDGMKPIPYTVAMPILREGERVIAHQDGRVMGIVTDFRFRA